MNILLIAKQGNPFTKQRLYTVSEVFERYINLRSKSEEASKFPGKQKEMAKFRPHEYLNEIERYLLAYREQRKLSQWYTSEYRVTSKCRGFLCWFFV